jgi:hypothetical protein
VRIVGHARRKSNAHLTETSKRWIVDRTSLRRARLDDLQYVDDPEHLDFLGIYFANSEPPYVARFCLLKIDVCFSDYKTWQKIAVSAEGHCDCHGILSKILSEELV